MARFNYRPFNWKLDTKSKNLYQMIDRNENENENKAKPNRYADELRSFRNHYLSQVDSCTLRILLAYWKKITISITSKILRWKLIKKRSTNEEQRRTKKKTYEKSVSDVKEKKEKNSKMVKTKSLINLRI